ncbi:MAG: hypothetical protein R2692_02750 [Microbacterium sp.]
MAGRTTDRLGDGLHWNIVGLYGGARGAYAFASEPGSRASASTRGRSTTAAAQRRRRRRREPAGARRRHTERALLGTPFHYRDERTARGVAAHERMPHAELFERNGLQFLPFNTLYQFAAESPALLEIADTALLIPDLLAFWLTGQARAEVTNARRRACCAGATTRGTIRSSTRSPAGCAPFCRR